MQIDMGRTGYFPELLGLRRSREDCAGMNCRAAASRDSS